MAEPTERDHERRGTGQRPGRGAGPDRRRARSGCSTRPWRWPRSSAAARSRPGSTPVVLAGGAAFVGLLLLSGASAGSTRGRDTASPRWGADGGRVGPLLGEQRLRGPFGGRAAGRTADRSPARVRRVAGAGLEVQRTRRSGKSDLPQRRVRCRHVAVAPPRYSHSMVPGGLLVTSSTTRLTSATSLVIRVEMRSSTSYGQARPVGGHRVLDWTPAAARSGARRCGRRPARRRCGRRPAAPPGTARSRRPGPAAVSSSRAMASAARRVSSRSG